MKKKYPTQLKQFGKKIKELRTSENLFQHQLAKKCGITRKTIQRIEKGEFAAGLNVVIALAQSLNATAEELLGDIISEKKSK